MRLTRNLALIAAAVILWQSPTARDVAGDVASEAAGAAAEFVTEQPTTVAAPTADRAHAAPVPAGPGEHSFLRTVDGRPVTWDPCSPIRWTTNLALAPAGAADEVHGAIERIAAATGFEFVYVGETAAVPTNAWSVTGGDGTGNGYAPLNIAVVDAASTDLLEPGHPANGGADRINGPAGPVYVSGSVVIDAAYVDDYARGFGPGSFGGLVLHELGHTMGLDHVTGTSDVMNPLISAGPGELGPGDLAGLATLAAGPCTPAR